MFSGYSFYRLREYIDQSCFDFAGIQWPKLAIIVDKFESFMLWILKHTIEVNKLIFLIRSKLFFCKKFYGSHLNSRLQKILVLDIPL